MVTNIVSDVQKGLVEKRICIDQLCEGELEEKKHIVLGTSDEADLQTHLHVIDTSIEKAQDGTLGICKICHGRIDDRLLQMDYTASVCLEHFSPEERRQLESELELSQIVQRALLPQTIPSIQGLDVAAFSRPAQIVGGDYFDFLQFKDGTPGFVIADVSGHGVSAGMLMTSLQMAFHTLVPESLSPAYVLERINRLYIHNIKFTTFVTVFFGCFEPATRTLTYANAGHNAPLVYRSASNEVDLLNPTSAAIGLIEEFNTQVEKIELATGDRLLLYTDGVTEAFNARGELFGEDRLADVMLQNHDLSPEGLIQAIRQTLSDFADGRPLTDDVTLVVFGIA